MPGENEAARTIIERAALRWPAMMPRAAQSILRLPQGSRVRNAMLRRAARLAFEAWNRADFELVPHIDDPDVETHITQGERTPIGLDAVYYGPEGHCRSMEIWNDAWRKWDAEIEDLIEEGRNRVVVIAQIHVEGEANGVTLDEWGAVRYTFRQGQIVRVDAAFETDKGRALEAMSKSRPDALEAAGLQE